jgi:TatD DNase family protein
LLAGVIDVVSVSLNAPESKQYQNICSSQFGGCSYDGVLDFIKESKKYLKDVIITAVDLPGIDMELCRKIAEKDLNAKFKQRYIGRVG